MAQKKKTTKESQGESLFIKALIAGLTLLTSMTNLIIAIINLSDGKTFAFVLFIVLFFVFAIISVVSFSLRKVQINAKIKTKDEYDSIISSISSVTHGLLHRVRDSIYFMENAYENKQFSSVIDFEEFVTSQILQLMDFMSQELSKLTKCDVRTCIKSIYYTTDTEDEIISGKLVTFARSGYKNVNEMMQEHREPIVISENTDFLSIVSSEKNRRQRQYFFETNLEKYDQHLRKNGDCYKNSNIAWKEDYITTIVCPIRLKRKKSFNNSFLVYDLIGFLCADSLDETAFTKETKTFCLDIMKGMADILYVYLDRFMDNYAELKEESNR